MSAPDVEEFSYGESASREGLENSVKRTMLTGAAVTVPLIITALVLALVVQFIVGLLDPVVQVLDGLGLTGNVQDAVVMAMAIGALLVLVFLVGAITERRPDDGHVVDTFDAAVERIPGIGTIYTSVNRMSTVMLESDSESFQEVKLVEFPHDEMYAIAFLTARAPEALQSSVGHGDMVTLFVPLTPNPFVGGHLVTVPEDHVHDVDMTVEEGIQAVVTSGVAVDEHADDER